MACFSFADNDAAVWQIKSSRELKHVNLQLVPNLVIAALKQARQDNGDMQEHEQALNVHLDAVPATLKEELPKNHGVSKGRY